MRRAFRYRHVPSLFAASFLAACTFPLEPHVEQVRAGFKDVAVREFGFADDGGRLLEVSSTSLRPLNLLEAQTHLDIDGRCADGRRYELEWRAPIVGAADATTDFSKSWPARTLFDVKVHCERPLPNEFVAGADVDRRMLELLPVDARLTAQDRAQRFIYSIRYWDSDYGPDREKYHAFSEFVGDQTRKMFVECGGAVVVRGLAATTGVPKKDAATGTAASEMLAGISLECADNDNAETTTP